MHLSVHPYTTGLAAASSAIITLGLVTAPPNIDAVVVRAEGHTVQLDAAVVAEISTAAVNTAAAIVHPAAATATQGLTTGTAPTIPSLNELTDFFGLFNSFLTDLNSFFGSAGFSSFLGNLNSFFGSAGLKSFLGNLSSFFGSSGFKSFFTNLLAGLRGLVTFVPPLAATVAAANSVRSLISPTIPASSVTPKPVAAKATPAPPAAAAIRTTTTTAKPAASAAAAGVHGRGGKK